MSTNQRRGFAATRARHMRRKWRCAQTVIIMAAAILTMTTTTSFYVNCAKLDAQIKLLINDEALLLQQPEHLQPTASAYANGGGTHDLDSAHSNDENQQHFDMYRSSELRRLSYETIHRILRDENEPIYRREDAEMRYYQKRSYQPTHEVFRRSADTQQIAADHQPVAQHLNMSSSNLAALPAALLAGIYTQLHSLDLSNNALVHINLTLLPQLHYLDLSHNRLTAMPLPANSSLTMLNLNGNHIKSAKAPANCSHLRELHLSSNEIENLTALNFSALNALELLDLSCNRIENLETAFFPQRMHNLKYLNLAHNRLGCIYRETFYNLLSLNTLILTRNNITDIDYETFLALPNLQYLDLSHNQLRGESIRALQGIPDLVGLSIAYNPELGSFMQEFVASWSLKELDASGTGLCQIPAALAQSVRTLKLTDNWLKIINCGDLDSYPLLQYLDLSNSRIEDIEDDALGRLEILEILFLDNNNLRKVPISLPTSLHHLFLQHNQIMDIQVQAFQALTNLQTLDLSHNKLLYLPALPLPKLLTLNLQSSELRGINQAIVHTLPRLRDMLLEDNPIKCSDLLGIAEWASPCRVGERTAMQLLEQDEQNELGQQESAKIDLKLQFVQMHNFFENFKNKCSSKGVDGGQTELQSTTPPPACAIEMDADLVAEITTVQSGQTEAEVITLNLPSEESSIKDSSNSNSSDLQQLYEEQKLRTTQSLQRSVQFNEANATATTISSSFDSRSSSDSNSNGNGNTLDTSATSKTLPEKFVATTTITRTDSKIVDIGEATTNLWSNTDLDADTEDANHVELETNPINLRTSKAATTAATINFKQQPPAKAQTMMASKSTLNKSQIVGSSENVAAYSSKVMPAITTTEIHNPTTEETTVYTMLPQTISTTIKSGSSNSEIVTTTTSTTTTTTTTTGLLSKQELKASAAVKRHSDAEQIDKKNNSNNNKNNINNNNQANNSKQNQQQHLNFNEISGQFYIDSKAKTTTTAPKTKTTTLLPRNEQQQLEQQRSQHNITHKHEPLHIKDRHLIGTPLLMLKGHNILDDQQEQLLLPTATAATQPKLVSTTVSNTTIVTTMTDTATMKTQTGTTDPTTTGKGSQSAYILDFSQNPNDPKEPHLSAKVPIGVGVGVIKTAALDKLPEPEAIKLTTNEQPQYEPFMLSVSDKKEEKTTETIKTNVQKLHNDNNDYDNRAAAAKNPKLRSDKQKLSLTMKKMTLTKVLQSTATAIKQTLQPQPQQHQYLNTPRRENEASDIAGWQLFKELKTDLGTNGKYHQLPQHKQHVTINTPINNNLQQHLYPDLPQLAAVEQQYSAKQQQHQELHEGISKSEQWLDIRKPAANTGHPGLLILVSSVAFVILLIGLIQVYRCDKPWRQRRELRPHQRSFNNDENRDSFLSYNNQQQHQLTTPLKWHHSTRLLPPHRSPLHNLHVRELQKCSAVELPLAGCTKSLSNNQVSGNRSSSSSCSSHSSSQFYPSAGTNVMDDDAFYVEMTPNSGQIASCAHSDLLPMELLNVASNKRSTNSDAEPTETMQSLEWQTDTKTVEQSTQLDRLSISNNKSTTKPIHNHNELAASSGEHRVPLNKLAPTTTRKFGLW